jgi:hypothetical protein
MTLTITHEAYLWIAFTVVLIIVLRILIDCIMKSHGRDIAKWFLRRLTPANRLEWGLKHAGDYQAMELLREINREEAAKRKRDER